MIQYMALTVTDRLLLIHSRAHCVARLDPPGSLHLPISARLRAGVSVRADNVRAGQAEIGVSSLDRQSRMDRSLLWA